MVPVNLMQATSAMFATKNGWKVRQSRFQSPSSGKIAGSSRLNSSKFKVAAISWGQIATKSPLVYTRDVESPQKSPQKSPVKKGL